MEDEMERAEGTDINEYSLDLSELVKSANDIIPVSRQLDEFAYEEEKRPPYNPNELISLVEMNDSIKQLVEAMATNVSLFGHAIKYNDDFDFSKASEDIKKKAEKEWELLRLKYKYINPMEDFSQIIYKALIDKYTIGWGCIEVIRNGESQVTTLEYMRACNVRIVANKDTRSNIEMWEETLDNNGSSKYTQISSQVKFKKFVQIINGEKVYFKEFGDTRSMDAKTGEYKETDNPATEVLFINSHCPYSDYGVPFWINASISASGSVQADILNFKYFADGKILPMAIVVSGGKLTKESVNAIRTGKGVENAFKTLVLEAAPYETKQVDGTIVPSRITIDIKSLTDSTNTDSLFQEFQKQCKEKIRDTSRLPPIFTGASSDYNKATAETARQIAEEQIFIPERKSICSKLNKIINNENQIRYCELYLKGAIFSDLESKNAILKTLADAGALTPNMLITVTEQVLGKDLEVWDEDKGNIPFKLLLQESADQGNDESDTAKIEALETARSEIKKTISEVVNYGS